MIAVKILKGLFIIFILTAPLIALRHPHFRKINIKDPPLSFKVGTIIYVALLAPMIIAVDWLLRRWLLQ